MLLYLHKLRFVEEHKGCKSFTISIASLLASQWRIDDRQKRGKEDSVSPAKKEEYSLKTKVVR